MEECHESGAEKVSPSAVSQQSVRFASVIVSVIVQIMCSSVMSQRNDMGWIIFLTSYRQLIHEYWSFIPIQTHFLWLYSPSRKDAAIKDQSHVVPNHKHILKSLYRMSLMLKWLSLYGNKTDTVFWLSLLKPTKNVVPGAGPLLATRAWLGLLFRLLIGSTLLLQNSKLHSGNIPSSPWWSDIFSYKSMENTRLE